VLIRSTTWNFLGQAIPLLIAIPALPLLVSRLGIERFGVLTLVWLAIGYFSLFDLGLGRALTQVVARKLGAGSEDMVADLVNTGLALMGIVSLAGASLVWLIAPWLAHAALHVPLSLQAETLSSLNLIAISLPFIVTSSGFTGLLAAYQRFDVVNAIRAPAAALTILLPVIVSVFTVKLEWITATVVTVRVLAWISYWIAFARVVPQVSRASQPRGWAIRELFRLGGWMTFTNILSPFLVYVDRFVIAGIASVASVAYYSTPYEVITKLLIIPAAIAGALFPAFATTFVGDKEKTSFLLAQGAKVIFLSLFPITLTFVVFADEILRAWLGQEFSANSGKVLQILAVGVLVNSLAHPATVLIQGAGRPDRIAKLHLIELALYLPILWYLAARFGIEGAAVAWTLRVTLDAVLLQWIASLLLPSKEGALLRTVFRLLLPGAALAVGFAVAGTNSKIAYFVVVTGVFCLIAWKKILLDSERTEVQRRLFAAFGDKRRQ
jgi:O-antigen/teichoic acid export membrane protein